VKPKYQRSPASLLHALLHMYTPYKGFLAWFVLEEHNCHFFSHLDYTRKTGFSKPFDFEHTNVLLHGNDFFTFGAWYLVALCVAA